MKLFIVITLSWAVANIIVGIFRFGIIKEKVRLKDFILIDLIGTYALVLVMLGVAYLIVGIVGILGL